MLRTQRLCSGLCIYTYICVNNYFFYSQEKPTSSGHSRSFSRLSNRKEEKETNHNHINHKNHILFSGKRILISFSRIFFSLLKITAERRSNVRITLYFSLHVPFNHNTFWSFSILYSIGTRDRIRRRFSTLISLFFRFNVECYTHNGSIYIILLKNFYSTYSLRVTIFTAISWEKWPLNEIVQLAINSVNEMITDMRYSNNYNRCIGQRNSKVNS